MPPGVCSKVLTEDISFKTASWMLDCFIRRRMPQDKQLPPDDKGIRPAVYQVNIDRVTDELGRHTGDAGETRRLKALMEKRDINIASDRAKKRREKSARGTGR
jgi:hypothetical protein